MCNFANKRNRNLNKLMNTKKLIVFLVWAFLPMVIVGLVMHFSGASAVGLQEEPSTIDPLAAIKGLLFSAGAMLTEPCSFRYSPLSLRN